MGKEINFIEVPEDEYFSLKENMQKINHIAGCLYYHAITDPQKRANEVYKIYELSKTEE